MIRLDHRMVIPPTAQGTHVTFSQDLAAAFPSWPYLEESTTQNTRIEVLEIGSRYVQPNYFSTNVSTSEEKQETQTINRNNMIMFEQDRSLGSELIVRHKNVSVSKFLKESCPQPKLNPTSSSPKSLRNSSSADNKLRREKANEREKQRIVVLKHAMNVLKNAIPAAREKTKITKLEILKLAREYINSLRELLEVDSTQEVNDASMSEPFFDPKDLFVYCNDSQ